jgi:hypothetical protein
LAVIKVIVIFVWDFVGGIIVMETAEWYDGGTSDRGKLVLRF